MTIINEWIIMKMCKAPTLRIKVLTHIMYIELENVIRNFISSTLHWEMEIDRPKTVCGCPCGGIICFLIGHTRSNHTIWNAIVSVQVNTHTHTHTHTPWHTHTHIHRGTLTPHPRQKTMLTTQLNYERSVDNVAYLTRRRAPCVALTSFICARYS